MEVFCSVIEYITPTVAHIKVLLIYTELRFKIFVLVHREVARGHVILVTLTPPN